MTHPFQSWVDVANPRLGAYVGYVTDDFFGAAERLIKPAEPVFIPDKYDDHGKWMDGWESRRRREGGHDYCEVQLGAAARIAGVDIDTRHFTGNYPPEAALEGRQANGEWVWLISQRGIDGDAHNFLSVAEHDPVDRVRLHIYPDGGVARLRLFGQMAVQPKEGTIDLVAIENGGRALACSDEHYGKPNHLILPGDSENMGDGWETRRRRGPGHDWAIVAMGHAGVVERLEIFTQHFKGNYPARCSVEVARTEVVERQDWDRLAWTEILPPEPLSADGRHEYSIAYCPYANILRLNIYPDGGISRFRVWGTIGDPDA